MRQVLDEGYRTGFFAPAAAQIGRLGRGLGADTSTWGMADPTKAELFQSGVMRKLLDELAAQKGPQTEGDADRALKTFAQLGNTTDANRWLLEYASNLLNRKIERAEFYNEHLRANDGKLDVTERQWKKYRDTLPSITKEHPMPNNPVMRILEDIEALESLSGLLEDSNYGISRMLAILAKDLKECGESLNDILEPAEEA